MQLTASDRALALEDQEAEDRASLRAAQVGAPLAAIDDDRARTAELNPIRRGDDLDNLSAVRRGCVPTLRQRPANEDLETATKEERDDVRDQLRVRVPDPRRQ
jgi:hypothetical protein